MATAEALNITIPEGTKPIRAINRALLNMRLETNRKLMKRGFIVAGIGLGAVTAAAIALPFLPVATAAFVAGEAGLAVFGAGAGVGLFGALKNAVDKNRRM